MPVPRLSVNLARLRRLLKSFAECVDCPDCPARPKDPDAECPGLDDCDGRLEDWLSAEK